MRSASCGYPVCIGAVTYKRIKGNRRGTDRKFAKNDYLVMEVVSVAAIVDAEVVRSAYVPNK